MINNLKKHFKKNKYLYLMLIPAIIWYLIFAYLPMGGTILAFKKFRFDMGVLKSPWVGLDNFKLMFKDSAFLQAFKNTFILSFGKLLFCFPFPIIMAILIHELRYSRFQRFFQTVFTFPHFISWVVLASIFTNIFASNGIVNQLLAKASMKPISPLVDVNLFRPFIWISYAWKEFGWDAIVYLAALVSINPRLYEAAEIDGANRLQLIRYISIPGISNVIAIMFILQVGNIMGATNFNQIFNLYSAPVYSVGDIIDTYVQRYTFVVGANFGYTTAVGLFKSLISVIFITIANKLVTKKGHEGLM